MAIITEEAMRAAVALADSDLQFVLQEANASLQTQYKIVQVHQTRRRFQAIADDRAQARTAGAQDFGLDPQTVEGRAQLAAVVAAWEMSKGLCSRGVQEACRGPGSGAASDLASP